VSQQDRRQWCNLDADRAQLEVARSITPIVSVQNMYNLRNRTSEDVLAACERLGIAFLPWYPLGGKRGLRALKIKQVASRAKCLSASRRMLVARTHVPLISLKSSEMRSSKFSPLAAPLVTELGQRRT
jgi:aryl-alcohol dehydrogenase-like predicted oxidoreductase